MSPRTPRSVFYDGAPYARLVESMLTSLHGFVAQSLPPGPRVLEACCGTGGLAARMAAGGREVLGVDLSPKNVAYAADRHRQPNLRYEVGDVAHLEVPEAGRYDVATVVLALHEMPAEARPRVLGNLLGLAERVLVVDFRVPMPRNAAGVRNRFMEVAAGRTHFLAFRDFNRRGGLPRLFEQVGAAVETERFIDSGTLHVATVRG